MFEGVHPLMATWIVIAVITLFLGVTCYPLWYILHRFLSKRLDPLLLKEPYFTRAEQFNYQFFPLYLVKAINYVYLVAWPTLAKKKRFKGLNHELPISPALRAACIVLFSLMLFGTLVFLVWLALMLYVLLIL